MDNTDPYKTKFKEERLYMSTNQNLMQHMRELIDRIKAADVAYYRDDNPTMTDREYLDDNAQFFAKIAFQIEHIQNGGDAI